MIDEKEVQRILRRNRETLEKAYPHIEIRDFDVKMFSSFPALTSVALSAREDDAIKQEIRKKPLYKRLKFELRELWYKITRKRPVKIFIRRNERDVS